MKIPFVGPTYTSRSLNMNAQTCRNFYLEADPSGKNKVALYPTPGLYQTASVSTGPCRGNGIVFGSYAYFVINNMLYRFDGFTLTGVGTITTISGRVYMAVNGTQLMLVDGTAGWIYDGSTLTQITDGDFPSCTHVKYLDSYFIVNNTNTGKFYLSAINDGASWAALDFATAQRNPDNLVAIDVAHRELWLFGTNSTEVWYNSGAPDFPLAPIQGGFVEWGCAAAHSVGKVDNNLVWLARTETGGPVVVTTMGYTPQVISTPPLSYEFSSYSTISDAFAQTYTKAGHDFYEITFPAANKTWLFDASVKQWSELTSGTGRHRTTGIVYLNNAHYAGDYSTGNIYKVDFNTYNEVISAPITTTLSRSGGTVTATAVAHPYSTSDRITIKGADQSAYNGTFDLVSTTTDTFTYLISTAPTTPATGTITSSIESPIIRTRACAHISKDLKWLTHHELQIDFEAGVGATYGQGSSPTALLRWSDDGGHTWSSVHAATIGALGQYGTRAIWRRLGSSRDRVYEVSVSDPVRVVIIGADLRYSENDS